MKYIVYLCRILVGGLFIISGLIKANDPLGFGYKLVEYFEVFGTEFLIPLALPLAMFICILEVVLGIATIIGYRMVPVTWGLLLLIIGFTFLTFYSAYFDVVKDCGCFGDALKLTPWESFTKDIILLILILPIFLYRNKIEPIFKGYLASALVVMSLILCTGFTLYCYSFLPVVDFRAYAMGKDIKKQMEIPDDADKGEIVMIFKYEKDGVVHEFGMNDLPANIGEYTFVDREDKVIREGFQPAITDFRIDNSDGQEYTDDFLDYNDYWFMVVCYDLNKTNKKAQEEINEFAKSAEDKGIRLIGLTGTLPSDAEAIRHEFQNPFEYYFCDEIVLKTIVRSNPGLVLMHGGEVKSKWHHNELPNFKDLSSVYFDNRK